MYKIKLNEALIKVLYLFAFAIVFCQIFSLYSLTSLLFAMTYVVVMILYFMNIYKKFNKKDLLVIFIVIYSFINILIVSNTTEVEYIKKWLMFSFCILYFSIITRISISEKIINNILNYNIMIMFFFMIAYVVLGRNAFYYTHTGVSYLTFGFYNPNVTALFMTVIGIASIIKFSYTKKIRKSLMCGIIIIMFYFINQTKSRTSLLIYALFIVIVVLYLIRNKIWIPKSKISIICIASFPIIFVWIYLVTIEMVSEISILNFLVSEGKGLDSRVFIWESALNLVYKSPIFGIYSELGKSISHAQMHNSHMDVLASYGVIILVLLIKFLYDVLIQMRKESINSFQKLAWWGFVCSLSLGIGEAALFSGGLSFYLLVGQFILFVNCKKEYEDKGK